MSAVDLARFGLLAKGNTARAHGWLLTSDFECGNGEHVAIDGPNAASWSPEADPGDDYNGGAYYFCCRVANEHPAARSIALAIHAHHEPVWQGWSMGLGSPLILLGEEADGADPSHWRQIPASEMETSQDVLRATIAVPGGGVRYVSNFYWYPPSRVQARLQAIAAARPGDVQPFIAGHSAQGRPIAGVRLPAPVPDAPRVVLTGTTQPSEGGQLPCLWALEYLLSDTPPARRFREAFTFDVVPATNPDGVALGTCMTNSRGENPLFDARAAADGGPSSAESAGLWRLVAGDRHEGDTAATGYLEYHFYFQTGRPCRPYVVAPELFADAARRATYERTSAALRDISDGHQIFVQPGNARFRHSLIYVAAERLGVAGHLYKLNTILPAPECRTRAIAVLERYFDALLER
ncbi:MAG: hypothetical protein HY332_25395 [Chloroflexi bacterium]|nr:hypothetical protein [Chloroflexota bacterium]